MCLPTLGKDEVGVEHCHILLVRMRWQESNAFPLLVRMRSVSRTAFSHGKNEVISLKAVRSQRL